MSEKKNIVIKVKYPTAGSSPVKPSSTRVVTQWNYKRLGILFGTGLLVLISIVYFNGSNDPKNTSSAQLPLPVHSDENNKPAVIVNKPSVNSVDINKFIVRAQLTKDINKNEPVDLLKPPLKIGKKETLWIYYFVELKGMKGRTIYHEWLLNGESVSRKKVNISADSWRTASKQVISYTMNNDWLVRVVDESGNKLSEEAFNLELK